MNWHRAQHVQQRADEGMPKERCVGKHGDGAGHNRDDQHRVDHRIMMVGGDDYAACGWDPLAADHVNPTIVEPQ